MLLQYPAPDNVNDLNAVKNLNLTEDMQIFLDLARKNMLEDLKNCISQYL